MEQEPGGRAGTTGMTPAGSMDLGNCTMFSDAGGSEGVWGRSLRPPEHTQMMDRGNAIDSKYAALWPTLQTNDGSLTGH